VLCVFEPRNPLLQENFVALGWQGGEAMPSVVLVEQPGLGQWCSTGRYGLG